ncbi:hypothetical protein MNBD_GAMMA16-273 [hydrothermal vent metagenome]|uniref:Plastocyanin-like domain-containing protein n=1 Tax=hydrothermal vent metagenome TaxID=652676 RepID=A0A3B0ZEA0_9ZZZZ
MIGKASRNGLFAVGQFVLGQTPGQGFFGCTVLIIFALSDNGVAFAQASTFQNQQKLHDTSVRQISIDVEDKAQIKKVIPVRQGEQVILLINGGPADTAAIYHLHGYNLMAKANDDHIPSIFFQADYTGRYPLVLHQHDPLIGVHEITIAYIEVKSM